MITMVGNILTSDGTNLLTAVNGGGLGPNNNVSLNTNRTVASAWETFNLILQPGSVPIGPGMKFALQTSDGKHYLTAVNGGGIGGANDATCPVHADAKVAGSWETFVLQVNNNAVPVTVQIMPYNPSAGPFFVTAVNGGGIGDGGTNTTPVHTDATAVGVWEQFSFTGSVVSTVPVVYAPLTNIDIKNPLGGVLGNIAGSCLLTIGSDGSCVFSGGANNSVPLVTYDYNFAALLVGADGAGYSFTASGSIGASPFGNPNFAWVQSTTSAAIQANWDKSLGLGWKGQWSASANTDVGILISNLVAAFQDVGTIVSAVTNIIKFIEVL